VVVTLNSIVRMIVSATTDDGQAVASGKKSPRSGRQASVAACIVTHRGPTSPKRHDPAHRAHSNYRCTLIYEEPINDQFGAIDAHGATIRAQPMALEAEHQAIVRDVLAASDFWGGAASPAFGAGTASAGSADLLCSGA
jgi:hypothetical protein